MTDTALNLIRQIQGLLTRGFFAYPDLPTEPAPPANGFLIYSYGGALKKVDASGTRTVI